MKYLLLTSNSSQLSWIPFPLLFILFPTLFYFNFVQGSGTGVVTGVEDELMTNQPDESFIDPLWTEQWMTDQPDGSSIDLLWTEHFHRFISHFRENYMYVEGLEFNPGIDRTDMSHRFLDMGKAALNVNVLIHLDNNNPDMALYFKNWLERVEIPDLINNINPEYFAVVEPIFQEINNLMREIHNLLDNNNSATGFDGNQITISNVDNILNQLFTKFCRLSSICRPRVEDSDWFHWVEFNIGEFPPRNITYLRQLTQIYLID